MAQTCRVCRLANRNEVEEALLAGEPLRNIAERSGTSATALHRHKEAHLPIKLVRAAESREIDSAESLTAKLRAIEAEARRLGQKAEKAGDTRTALVAIRELVRLIELAARIQAAKLQAGGSRDTTPKESPERQAEHLTEILAAFYAHNPGDFLWGLRKAGALHLVRLGREPTFEEAFARLEKEERAMERAIPTATRMLADGDHKPSSMFEVSETSDVADL
jgi:hypothetical protein